MALKRRSSKVFIWSCLFLLFGCAALKTGIRQRETVMYPVPEREFRAVWVATVANIDWPSAPGLSPDEQKNEAIAILDRAKALNLNAIILQVRPQCDAFYASDIEPWSYFLTGEQGRAPDPWYDPLAFWIEEAHNRGIELHAWFNPYRAHHPNSGDVTGTSVVRTHPGIVRELKGGYWWLDPSKKETQDYTLGVIMDVVRRYDIDGVHLDDYFYPYPSYNDNEDFPDDDTWNAYRNGGGHLSRGDWRRDSVNTFIRRLYRAIKSEKRYVIFGISPFGIWRPNNPSSIIGFDQYGVLYADAKLWLNRGWVDYFTPQLYWPIGRIPQSYPVLLGWWVRENTRDRNLWPGLYTSRITDERGADENVGQILVTRGFLPERPGNVHFSMKALLDNRGGIADSLVAGPYRTQALVPLSPWLDDKAPAAPIIDASVEGENLVISWKPGKEDVFRWIVYIEQGGVWRYVILNRQDRNYTVCLSGSSSDGSEIPASGAAPANTGPVTRVAVSAIDRMGNESTKTLVRIGE